MRILMSLPHLFLWDLSENEWKKSLQFSRSANFDFHEPEIPIQGALGYIQVIVNFDDRHFALLEQGFCDHCFIPGLFR